jgi:hypothetical protein
LVKQKNKISIEQPNINGRTTFLVKRMAHFMEGLKKEKQLVI